MITSHSLSISHANISIHHSNRAEFRHPLFTQDSTPEEVNSLIKKFGKPAALVVSKSTRPVRLAAQPKAAQKIKIVQHKSMTLVQPTGEDSMGVQNRYVKQICHWEGCYKYMASHCGGYCMSHYNEMHGIPNNSRGPYKKTMKVKKIVSQQALFKKAPLPKKEKGKSPENRDRDRPKHLRQLQPVDEPNGQPTEAAKHPGAGPNRDSRLRKKPQVFSPPQTKTATTPRTSSSKKPKRKSPSPQKTPSGRAKPMKSLYPHSKQNEYSFPTGHAVAHLPAEAVPEFGDGWTTRTLKRPNAKGTKVSDTYFYSPVVRLV